MTILPEASITAFAAGLGGKRADLFEEPDALDALRGHLDPEAVAEADDRPHDRRGAVGAVQVFDQLCLQGLLIGHVAHTGGDGGHACLLAGTVAAFSEDDFVLDLAVGVSHARARQGAQQDGGIDAAALDVFGELGELCGVEGGARVGEAGDDLAQGDVEELIGHDEGSWWCGWGRGALNPAGCGA